MNKWDVIQCYFILDILSSFSSLKVSYPEWHPEMANVLVGEGSLVISASSHGLRTSGAQPELPKVGEKGERLKSLLTWREEGR